MGEECGGWEAIPLIRLHIVSEGQTEETFINGILAPALAHINIFVDTRRIETGRHHGRPFRGGHTKYEHLARDLILWMKQDQNADAWFTTMIDYYGLPAKFPELASLARSLSPLDRVKRLEVALSSDIHNRLAGLPVSQRFIPYIQLHEFEAMLFSCPSAFSEAFPDKQASVARVAAIADKFPNPEDIDDQPLTAPSKRILEIFPEYEKPVAGLLIATRIGLPSIRQRCPHFNQWISQLEALVSPTAGGPPSL